MSSFLFDVFLHSTPQSIPRSFLFLFLMLQKYQVFYDLLCDLFGKEKSKKKKYFQFFFCPCFMFFLSCLFLCRIAFLSLAMTHIPISLSLSLSIFQKQMTFSFPAFYYSFPSFCPFLLFPCNSFTKYLREHISNKLTPRKFHKTNELVFSYSFSVLSSPFPPFLFLFFPFPLSVFSVSFVFIKYLM